MNRSKSKGPSLDAIRKFKQQQEQKKRDEDERKAQEKLYTLEHRALQGDKKAKVQLKKIEQDREVKIDNGGQSDTHRTNSRGQNGAKQLNHNSSTSRGGGSSNKHPAKTKRNNTETDFEELMRLAKTNTNELRVQEKPKEKIIERVTIPKRRNDTAKLASTDAERRIPPSRSGTQTSMMRSRVDPRPSTSRNIPGRPDQNLRRQPPPPHPRVPPRVMSNPGMRTQTPIRRYYDDDDDYDEEDEYESDGFVVNEDDDEVRSELDKTLKNIFRYDKRRCDLREQEIDRQYRAIGRVSTFEDLEREERRASRLAAAEDAKEQRIDEERKRMKRIRLKGLRA